MSNRSGQWQQVCCSEELPAGCAREFIVDGVPGFVLRQRSQLVAYRNQCPHQSLQLNWRPNEFLSADRNHIVCGNHGAIFDWQSGACIGGICQGSALTPWPVRELSGHIEVAGQTP